MKGLGGVEPESEDIRMVAEVREERKCHIGDLEDDGAMNQRMWVTSEGAFPGYYGRDSIHYSPFSLSFVFNISMRKYFNYIVSFHFVLFYFILYLSFQNKTKQKPFFPVPSTL